MVKTILKCDSEELELTDLASANPRLKHDEALFSLKGRHIDFQHYR